MEIRPTDATLGAVVSNVRLSSLTPQQWDRIERAFLEFAVLIFPDQHLSLDEQMAFGKRFGDLSIDSLMFSNEQKDGSLREDHDALMQLFKGNENWHTDSSFQPLAAKASILCAQKVPINGGETEWADMCAGYEALDAGMQDLIEDLSAFHSLYYSQSEVGGSHEATSQGLAELHANDPKKSGNVARGYESSSSPPLRSLVKTHPNTKRKALYIGRHAYGISGLREEESQKLLGRLLDIACQPPRILTLKWKVGDLVIWDNRCVLHRSRPWPNNEVRVMRHTRVNGDPQTETALNYNQ